MSLGQFCDCLKNCADKLEQDIRTNINEFHNMVAEGAVDEVKWALDKAKDYHYKEIIHFMEDIVNTVRKIILHEQEIRRLQRQERMTEEERRRHSYVRKQVNNFNGNAKVTRREIRRAASELSINSLEAWENYLDKRSETGLSTSLPELASPVQKRESSKTRKNPRKRSSTSNNILDNSLVLSQSLGNISEEDLVEDQFDDSSTAGYCDSIGRSRIKFDSESESREEDCHNNLNYCLSASRQNDDIDSVERLRDIGDFEKGVDYTVDCLVEQSTSETDGCETQSEQRFDHNNKTDSKEPFEENCWSDSDCDKESNSSYETETINYPVIQLIKSLNDVVDPGDTKPKIIDVVYKRHLSSEDPDGTG